MAVPCFGGGCSLRILLERRGSEGVVAVVPVAVESLERSYCQAKDQVCFYDKALPRQINLTANRSNATLTDLRSILCAVSEKAIRHAPGRVGQ